MVRFTPEQLRAMMDRPENIRNMSVIAHVDHGKTTLSDALVSKAGLISEQSAGTTRFTDGRKDEQLRCITIKSTAVSMFFEYNMDSGDKVVDAEDGRQELEVNENMFQINMIDSPGHVDFSSEVTAALRVTDGALVVVDTVDGVCVQTETVLRQAISERVKPVLVVNKLDRALLELHLPAEEIYQSMARAIESVNVIISTYDDSTLGDVTVHPEEGTVAFGSGLHQWAFTLNHFARVYAKKFGTRADKLVKKLWGDWFYDPEDKKWKRHNDGGRLQRGFCQFVMEPISRLFTAIMEGRVAKSTKMIRALGVTLKVEERELSGKPLLKLVMQRWLPAADAILEMIVCHLPSPVAAQAYRVDTLYDGPLDDEVATAIRNCDPNGPLCMYVSKMVPSGEGKSGGGRFIAFGRVFAGTVRPGQKVRLLGPNYVVGGTTDVWVGKSVQRTVVMMGRGVEAVSDVPAGNTCGLVGVDQFLLKSGTVTTSLTGAGIKTMKFSVSPVVRVAVEPKRAADLPKLVEGLKRLSQSDPMVQCYREESGEHIIAGAGELHLEICLKDLQEDFMNGAEVNVSEPVVPFRETITSETAEPLLAKSANKLNRIFASARPMPDGVAQEIDAGHVRADADPKLRARHLTDTYGWDNAAARKIWAFGPEGTGPNVLLDGTRAAMYLHEIKESVVAGFNWSAASGPLTGEPMRNVSVSIMDVMVHSDAPHRGTGQIMPAARRVVNACVLSAAPALYEPMYLVDINCSQDAVGGCYSVLSQRRGQVISEVGRAGTPMVQLRAYLPVKEAFGFDSDLRGATSGKAFPQCVFDHWKVVSGDVLEEGSKVRDLVRAIRARKGLSVDIPTVSTFADRL